MAGVVGKLASAGLVFKSDAEEAGFVARGHAQSMARMIETIGRDVQALGEWSMTADGPQPGLVDRLAGLRARLGAIRQELAPHRGPYVDAQLAALADANRLGAVKLHLGCGRFTIPSWINVDILPAPLRMDMTWGLPFASNSVAVAFSAHCLEHLSYKHAALALLREVHRVLAPGGVLRLVVPDIERCLRAYASDDAEYFDTRARHWEWAVHHRTPLEHFLAYAGAGAPLHECSFWHKYGYDLPTLSHLLGEAGFAAVRRSGYMESKTPDLRVDDQSPGAGFTYRGIHYDLFVEATKRASDR